MGERHDGVGREGELLDAGGGVARLAPREASGGVGRLGGAQPGRGAESRLAKGARGDPSRNT